MLNFMRGNTHLRKRKQNHQAKMHKKATEHGANVNILSGFYHDVRNVLNGACQYKKSQATITSDHRLAFPYFS